MIKSFKAWLAVTRPISNLTLLNWCIAAIIGTLGRSILIHLRLDMGYLPEFFGIYSAIVWLTFWPSMFFGTRKQFCSSVAHYIAMHALIIWAWYPDLGKGIALSYFIIWMFWMTDDVVNWVRK